MNPCLDTALEQVLLQFFSVTYANYKQMIIRGSLGHFAGECERKSVKEPSVCVGDCVAFMIPSSYEWQFRTKKGSLE